MALVRDSFLRDSWLWISLIIFLSPLRLETNWSCVCLQVHSRRHRKVIKSSWLSQFNTRDGGQDGWHLLFVIFVTAITWREMLSQSDCSSSSVLSRLIFGKISNSAESLRLLDWVWEENSIRNPSENNHEHLMQETDDSRTFALTLSGTYVNGWGTGQVKRERTRKTSNGVEFKVRKFISSLLAICKSMRWDVCE